MKKYTIITKEWFDRINGNSYNAVRIISNESGEVIIKLPFEYGYGTAGEWRARHWLKNNTNEDPYFISEIAICHKDERCLKRDVIAWGK